MSTEDLIEEKTEESEYERTARELGELLQELRVALPGVQVLFAFLLTVPFSARFGTVTPLQEGVFFDARVHGAFGGSVTGAIGSSQALVAVPRQGAPPVGGESVRYRGHGIARAGYDGYGLRYH